MNKIYNAQMPIKSQFDVIHCRYEVRGVAERMGFGIADQTRLATAVSELTRNALRHGGGGFCLLETCSKNEIQGIRVTIEDEGPGIPDLDKAMEEGFSTAERSMGMGLPASKRLVHHLSIESEPGHTKVCIEMYLKR